MHVLSKKNIAGQLFLLGGTMHSHVCMGIHHTSSHTKKKMDLTVFFFCVSVVFATGFLPEEKAVNQFQN